MTLPTTEIPQDRIERLADRVLAHAKACAAKENGRTFTIDQIYDALPDISRQRLSDAIKTLKDSRRIYAIGRSKGIYEIEEAFPPPRKISLTSMTDGWRLLEVGDEVAVALTPAEAAEVGGYLSGDAMRVNVGDKFKMAMTDNADLRRELAALKTRMRCMERTYKGQGELLEAENPHRV